MYDAAENDCMWRSVWRNAALECVICALDWVSRVTAFEEQLTPGVERRHGERRLGAR